MFFSPGKIIFIVSFILGIVLETLIKKGYLGTTVKICYLKLLSLSLIYRILILFVISFVVYLVLDYLGILILPNLIIVQDHYIKDFIGDNGLNSNNASSSSSESSVTIIKNDTTINVHNPDISIKRENLKSGLNKIAAGLSSAGGAATGIKAAQMVGGSPTVKVLVGVWTYAGVQAGTVIMSKILNFQTEVNAQNSSNINKIISDSVSSNSDNNLNIDNYPLNMLTDLDTLINVEILFLYIIFILFFSKFLKNINFNKYISNKSRLGGILLYLIERYLSGLDKSREILIIYSWVMIFFCTLVSKIAMFFILSSFNI